MSAIIASNSRPIIYDVDENSPPPHSIPVGEAITQLAVMVGRNLSLSNIKADMILVFDAASVYTARSGNFGFG